MITMMLVGLGIILVAVVVPTWLAHYHHRQDRHDFFIARRRYLRRIRRTA